MKNATIFPWAISVLIGLAFSRARLRHQGTNCLTQGGLVDQKKIELIEYFKSQ